MLKGLITERDIVAAEDAFPGIWRFYDQLDDKPGTFLELVWRFAGRLCEPPRAAASAPAGR